MAEADATITDAELLDAVLRPYKPNCRYLTHASVTNSSGVVTVEAEFGIAASFYIEDTGHFNSVEFNICFNQMFYYLIATSVKRGLLAPLKSWSLDDFWEHQLPGMLITSFRSRFQRKIDPRRFCGSVSMVDLSAHHIPPRTEPVLLAQTSSRFWDDSGGRANGEVKVMIVS